MVSSATVQPVLQGLSFLPFDDIFDSAVTPVVYAVGNYVSYLSQRPVPRASLERSHLLPLFCSTHLSLVAPMLIL